MKNFRRIIALLTILSVLCAFLPSYAAIDSQTRHTAISGWTIVSSFSDSEGFLDGSTAATGNSSLKLVNRTPKANDDTYLRADTTANVKAGKTYRLEFYAKSEKSVMTQLLFDWTGFYSLTPASDTYDWTKFKFLYTAADDATLNIRFLANSTTNGFWVDDIKFYDVEVGETGNLLANGDFEGGTVASSTTDEIPENMIVDVYPGTKTIDGKLDDWQSEEVHKLERVELLMDEPGEMISADIRYSFDDENLYFAVEVTDNSHNTSYKSTYWNGDSFQWCQGYVTDTTVVSRGVALYPEENNFVHQQTEDHQAMVVRTGNKTVYEIAMPWSVDFADNVAGVPATIRFNAIVNNNNGDGRAYALEINEGITRSKDINKYLYLRSWNPLADVAYRSTCVSTMNIGDAATATVYLANTAEGTKSIQLQATGYNNTVTLNSGEESEVAIPINLTTVGENEFNITLSSDGESTEIKNDVLVYHNNATYLEAKSKMEGYVAELKELLYQCASKGISTDYETAYYSLIARQLETMQMEAGYGVYDRVHIYEQTFDTAVPQIRAALEAYLAGEKTPFTVPKFVTGSEIEFDGSTIYSEMEVDGVKEKRPMFFIGYGQMYGAAYLAPFFSNLGANMIATDIEWRNVVKEINAASWNIDIKGDSNATVEVVEENEATDNYAFRVADAQASNVNNRYVRLRQTITVKPGTTYEFGLSAKGDAGSANPQIPEIWLNADGFAGTRQVLGNSDEWKDYHFEYTVPENDYSVDFSTFIAYGINNAYLDNFYFREKGTDENLVSNGDLQVAARELSDVEKRMAERGWYVDPTSVDWLENVLATAEENNVIVSVCLAPHHIPEFILKDDPDATAAGEHFMPWSPFNENVQEALKLWYEYYYSIITKYDCVYDTVIVNEPKIFANNKKDYYSKYWYKYLEDKYKTIDALKEVYIAGGYSDAGEFTKFEDVGMSEHYLMEPTPLYYDYICFNDSLLAEFAELVMGYAHEFAPNIKSSLKVMQYNHMNYQNYFKQGTNYEIISKLMDVNGCDSYSTYKQENRKMTSKMAWYDYITEVDDAPIWDTEVHILDDAYEISYDGLRPYYSSGEIWNGAVHKRSAATVWWWELRDTMQPAPIDPGGEPYSNSNLVYRPATAMANAKAMMDIQRLSREITALQDKEATVGLLYSRTSVPYSANTYMQAYNDAYEDIIFSGQKVKHIYDSEPEKLQSCDLLVVPKASNVKADMLENIKTFLDNGGKVLIIGTVALRKDEYNRDHNATLVNAIYNHKNTDKKSTIKEKISAMGLSEVVLVDATTGEALDMVEWSYTEYNGNIIVNIMDYTLDETATQVRDVKILYNGREITECKELRDDVNISGNLKIKPYQPVLIQFAK